MSANLQINTRVRRLVHYMEDIEKGLIQIPAFQRDFIWKTQDKLELFDSIKRGYPIGSVLFWRPENETFEEGQKIGPFMMPKKGSEYYYILDGFQRLSTMFGCLSNPEKTKLPIDKELWEKEYQICYDLESEEFFIPRTKPLELYQIPIHKLIDTREIFLLQRALSNSNISEEVIEVYIDRYTKLGTMLIDYQLPSIDIIGGEIAEAVEIFSRVNSKGAEISLDWMVSALSYNKDRQFRLGTLIDNLLEELKIYNFGTIKRELVLQCIINSFGRVYFDQSKKVEILAKRDDFIPITLKTIESIKKAVKFLFEDLLVIDSKLLPYSNQLIFVTDFFNQIESPSNQKLLALKNWFWITTYSGYFTIYSLSKQRDAYITFQKFISGDMENPVYNDRPNLPFEVNDFPTKVYFGSVRAKALILFLINTSNGFKSIVENKVDGLSLNFLFYDIRNEKGDFYPETVVPMITEIDGRTPKSKDMSYLLENYSPEKEKYFITPEMVDLYSSGNKPGVFSLRKNLIIAAERDYVTGLGLVYPG